MAFEIGNWWQWQIYWSIVKESVKFYYLGNGNTHRWDFYFDFKIDQDWWDWFKYGRNLMWTPSAASSHMFPRQQPAVIEQLLNWPTMVSRDSLEVNILNKRALCSVCMLLHVYFISLSTYLSCLVSTLLSGLLGSQHSQQAEFSQYLICMWWRHARVMCHMCVIFHWSRSCGSNLMEEC